MDPRCLPVGSGSNSQRQAVLRNCDNNALTNRFYVRNSRYVLLREGVPTIDPAIAASNLQKGSKQAAKYCLNGVINSKGSVCCDKQCGTCGGKGCSGRPGGKKACCSRRINGKQGQKKPMCKDGDTKTRCNIPKTQKTGNKSVVTTKTTNKSVVCQSQ